VTEAPRRVRTCGVLVLRDRPARAFLVLHRRGRVDLPKGKAKRAEGDREAALRELREETGLRPRDVVLDDSFVWRKTYASLSKRTGEPCWRTLTVFLGTLVEPRPIVVAEHESHAWIPWSPPHELDTFPLGSILEAVDAHLRKA